MTLVRETLDPGVLQLTIDRREAANALDQSLLDELRDAFVQAKEDKNLGCVILRGAGGRSFSAGYDLGALSAAAFRAQDDPIGPVCRAMQRCPLPIIACINGHVFGGALEIACAADIRFFQRGAKFGVPAARFGICYAPAGVSRLRAALGPALAARLLLSGQPLSIDELPVGLLGWAPCSPDTINQQALTLAREIACSAPLAVQGMTRMLRQLATDPNGGTDFVSHHRALFDRCLHSRDLQEGLQALADKRTPRFEGC